MCRFLVAIVMVLPTAWAARPSLKANQPGSWHTGQVPIGFDPEQFDLPNRLADLDDDGFLGLTREEISIVEVAPNPAAPIIFDVSALITSG